jgi:hypothetical protein
MNLQPWRLRRINLILLLIFVLLLTILLYQHFSQEKNIPTSDLTVPPKPQETPLAFTFKQKPEQYNQVGSGWLLLEKSTINAKLPELRLLLTAYGASKRPDDAHKGTKVGIGFINQPATSLLTGQKLYLKCDAKAGPMRWRLSEKNQPTNIWVTTEFINGQVICNLAMNDMEGKIIKEPKELSYFALRTDPLPILQANFDLLQGWQIGRDPVDSLLLTKQKAKWLGPDLFLDMYGGPEFAFTIGRERIDFESPYGSYTSFVKENDFLAFMDDHWERVEESDLSTGKSADKSLLEVKKITNESILFHLWAPEGRQKIALLLQKTPEPVRPAQASNLRLIGAKSRKEWIAEIGGIRMSISPDDWFLLHDGLCDKITTAEQIDDYLFGNIKGDLIVLEGIKKVGSDLSLVGNMFNDTRTKVSPIAVALYKTNDPKAEEAGQNRHRNENGRASRKQTDDDDDDDDDEDDEYDDEDDEEDDEDDDDDYI